MVTACTAVVMISVLVLFLCATAASAKKQPCNEKSKKDCSGTCTWFAITHKCIAAGSQPLVQSCSEIKEFPGCAPPTVDCDRLGKLEATPATASKSAVCGRLKKCACANGVGASGTACPKDGASKCVSCSSTFYLTSDACKAHTDCDKIGKVRTKAGTGKSDTVCGGDKKCTCPNGVGASGTACPKDKAAKCVACTGKFFLAKSECKARTDCAKKGKLEKTAGSKTADAVCGADFLCVCPHGSPATGTACPKHGSSKCTSCKAGFALDGGTCKVKGYEAPGFKWNPDTRRKGPAGTPVKSGDGACPVSESNTKVTLNKECGIRSTNCMKSGKWYWEASYPGTHSSGGAPFHANTGISREDAKMRWFDTCHSVMWYGFINRANFRHLGSDVRSVATCHAGGFKSMYFKGTCPHRNAAVECVASEPTLSSRLMFALDMDRGLFWTGHDGKWTYIQGKKIDKSNFDTLALELDPKDALRSGKAWCASAQGERGGVVKLHGTKASWKYGPPTKGFATW